MIAYESLGLALLHFVWQGLLVASALFVMLRLLARAGAEARYVVSVLALASMVALPVVTLWDLENHVLPLRAAKAAAEAGGAPTGDAPSAQVPVEPGPETAVGAEAAEVDVAPPDRTADAATPSGTRGERIGGVSWFDSLLRAGATLVGPRALRWTVWLWCAGVLFFSVRLLGGWLHLRRVSRVGTSAVPDAVSEAARVLADRIGVRRAVRLVRSAHISVPAVVGWIRPVILFPASALTGLTPAQLEAIIAHELAHVRRHDYLVNLLQSVVETLLFYHPAVWWVSGWVRQEREHCCDDLAIAACDGDRRLYAGALLDLEILRTPTPALAMAADGGSLVGRVRRLLGRDPAELGTPPRPKVGLMASTIAAFLMLACGGDALLFPIGDYDEGRGSRIPGGATGRPIAAPAGIVSWLPGDGHADDVVGAHDGILLNGATFGPGLVSGAFRLDGSDDYVALGNDPGLHLSSGEFTIEAWVRFDPSGIGRDQSIIDKMTAGPFNRDGWRLIKQSNDRFWFCFGGGDANGCMFSSLTTVESSTPASAGRWYHVAGVLGSSDFTIYVNGTAEQSKPRPRFTDTNTANLRIGKYVAEGFSHLAGRVDEVTIYNRALSASQIQEIYDAGSGGKSGSGGTGD